jgi:hypothetical protein
MKLHELTELCEEENTLFPMKYKKVRFPNGLGASIVRGEISLSHDKNLYELAVIEHKLYLEKPLDVYSMKEPVPCNLYSKIPIRADLTEEMVDDILEELENESGLSKNC